MTKHEKQILAELSKEQLIYLIEQLDHSQTLISCVLVDVSKWHIEPADGIRKIRGYMYDMPGIYDAKELKAYIDMKMEKISVEECRKIMGFDE